MERKKRQERKKKGRRKVPQNEPLSAVEREEEEKKYIFWGKKGEGCVFWFARREKRRNFALPSRRGKRKIILFNLEDR